jgi:trk system potassium uptake protein TrkA
LREANLPDGLLIGAVVRGNEIINPRGNTVINAGDRVVVFASADVISKVEKMFSVQLEYF